MRRGSPRMIALAGLLVLAVGCGKKDDAGGSSGSGNDPGDQLDQVVMGLDRLERRHRDRKPTAPPRAQPQLSVTLDGKAVPFQAALVWTRPDGTIEVLASSAPRACAEVTRDLVEYYPDEVMWSAILGRHLKPDGTLAWGVRQTHFSGMTLVGRPTPAEATGEARPGATVTVKLAFESTDAASGDRPKRTLKVSGTVDAQGCAPKAVPTAPAPALPPEQAAHVEVAGQKLALRGAALVQTADARTLTLSTGRATCGAFVDTAGAELTITLHYRKDKGEEAWQTDLNGEWIGGQLATQLYEKGRLTATPSRAEAGATALASKLDGALDIMGYAVKLSGQVTVPVCPPR